jgi:aspartate aminotransferase-like enzyme
MVTELQAKKKLIMLPGPTNVPDRIMQAMVRPVINHRGEAFETFYKGMLGKTKKFFQTEHEVVILTASGTGAVEAAVLSLIRPGDKAVVPVFGEFSERLADAVDTAGGSAVRVRSDLGTTPTLDAVEEAVHNAGNPKAVLVVHNETSTGANFQYLEKACEFAHEHGAFFVADAISSLGGYSIPVDKWGVDICMTGSQKCLAAPPGASLLSVSDDVLAYLKKSPPPTRYFNLSRYVEFGARGQTPFAPAIPIFFALDEALGMLLEEGLDNRVARHTRLSKMLYDGMAKMGVKPFPKEDVRSHTVLAAVYPPGVDDKQFRHDLSAEHDVVIAGGFGPLVGKVFRVGCMGEVSEEYVKRTLSGIEATLRKMGKLPI